MSLFKQLLILISLFVWSDDSFAQNNRKFYAKNAKPVDEDRYKDYRGSPYFFDDFVEGVVVDNSDNEYPNVLLNLNGYTGELEVQEEGYFVEIEKGFYQQFTAKDKAGINYLFKRNLHPDFSDNFHQVLYESEQVLLVKRFKVIYGEVVINNVGKTEKVKRFGSVYEYLLLSGLGKQTVTKLKVSKKKLPELLGKKKELTDYIKAEKLSFKNDDDLVTLIKHYETL